MVPYVIWDKVSKSGLSKYCGRQPLKNFKGYGLLKLTISLKIFKRLPMISIHSIQSIPIIKLLSLNANECKFRLKGLSQLAHDVGATLGFGCILVATSDNVVTLSQHRVSDVITTTKN